ncbi:hypothetical protein [Wolbachia endosymbiont (group A) of Beris morrisii]
MALESSLYYAATWLKLSLLDPSVKHWNDTEGATGMTGEADNRHPAAC